MSRPPPSTDSDVDVEGFLDGSLTPSALIARLVEAGLENGVSSSSAAAGPAGGTAATTGPADARSTPPGPVEAAECVLAEFDK